MTPKFTHLHVHSHYSLLDGLAKIDELVARAAELGMDALALTDHGNMYGAIEFYQKCRKAGVKPIIGAELYIAAGNMRDKNPGVDDKRFHLTALAVDFTGYKNLIKLITKAHLEGFYYKPRVDKNLLREHHKGIVALSGCLAGEIPRAIQTKQLERARRLVVEYQDIFGRENFFLELGAHVNHDEQRPVNAALADLSEQTNAPLAAAADTHYIKPEDAEAQDILVSVQTGSRMDDENRLTMRSLNLSLRSPEEMTTLFSDRPEAIARTSEIASRVNIEMPLGAWTFPNLALPEGRTYDEELERLAWEGLERRRIGRGAEVVQRLRYELDIIKKKGFSPYFLVVADLLRFAHERGILTNIRGSVAGSLVTYLTEITNINPLEYKLPFERFLNPERPSAPDIDMDFADNRRDEVIQYAKEKYGEDKVAQIGTFGTMLARAAVRDVARALGKPYGAGDRIAKLIPFGSQGFPMTIEHALETTPELRQLCETDPESRQIIEQARKLEGCVRHVSVHAAGVVIAPEALIEYAPLQLDPKGGKIITQYDMHAIEDVGLLKFDFLGIRNLSILGDAVRLARQHRNAAVDIENLPLDDKKTYEMLSRGETLGVFQLGGSGMTRYLRDLRPTSIHDINAMVALYRPGPIESIPTYIERKHNPLKITYLDPRMRTILDHSYGVVTYQDDVMLIAVEMAGYSWLEADKLRKAMGKKIPAEMRSQKEKLTAGLVEHGMPPHKAQEMWRLIEPFAAYGFNKSHAASYGRLAYQTAYMKANFPAEYMTAVLTAESGDIEKIAEVIAECRRMGIAVLPPDVNESFGTFTLIKGQDGRPDTVRFGLETVKNVGSNIVAAISEERERAGKFASLVDFAERVRHKDFNKKSLEALAGCGALDALGERNRLLANLETLLEYNRESQRSRSAAQEGLFGSGPDASLTALKLRDAEPMPKRERLQRERELLGLYVTEHPLMEYRTELEKKRLLPLRELAGGAAKNQRVAIGGLVNAIQRVTTKSGEPMLFVNFEDLTGRTEVLVFPKTLAQNPGVWQTEKILVIRGRVSDRDGAPKILCEDAVEIA